MRRCAAAAPEPAEGESERASHRHWAGVVDPHAGDMSRAAGSRVRATHTPRTFAPPLQIQTTHLLEHRQEGVGRGRVDAESQHVQHHRLHAQQVAGLQTQGSGSSRLGRLVRVLQPQHAQHHVPLAQQVAGLQKEAEGWPAACNAAACCLECIGQAGTIIGRGGRAQGDPTRSAARKYNRQVGCTLQP